MTWDFEQACERYRSLSRADLDYLVGIIVDSLGKVDKPIRQRMIENLIEADFELGRRVSKGLKA